MAGQRAVQAFQAAAIESGYLSFAPVVAQNMGLFVADRKLAIESVEIRYSAAAGSARVGQLSYVADGVAMAHSSAVDITETGGLNLNTTTNTKQTGVLTKTTGVPSANIVPAGSLVYVELDGAVGSLAGLIVTIRYTTVLI